MKPDFQIFGKGKPVVLLHAFPLSNKMWSDNCSPLVENGFSVILPNLLFESDQNSAMSDTSARIIELLDSLKIEKAIIGGLSMGGYVCFNMFRLRPQIFSALILCDTNSSADTSEKRKSRFELIKNIEETENAALIEKMLPKLVSDFTKNEQPEIYKKIERWVSDSEPTAHINALRAMANRLDHDNILAKINVPTQIIFGRDDKVTDLDVADKLNYGIKDSRLSVIDNSGHYSNLEQTEQFNSILADFCLSVCH